MPLFSFSAEQREAALNAASPDLKFHLSEVKAPVEVQAALYHKGLVGPDESHLEVRNAIAMEIGV